MTSVLSQVQEVVGAASSVPLSLAVAVVVFLTAAVTAVGTFQYAKTRPLASAGSDALLERQEGAWRQRMESMMTQLGETIAHANEKLVATIAAGDTEHRLEIRGFSEAVRDSTTAMRACVDEIKAQRADFAAYSAKGFAAMRKVSQLHAGIAPASPTRSPKRRRRHP